MNTIAISYREPVRLREHLVGASDQANLVAIDLPGFGGSARRDAWVGGRYRD
jgi:pimeloyl-ACP methyl ester carboxylesterase